ncbi:hypothetical protein D3C77_407010 [compost metagenome]
MFPVGGFTGGQLVAHRAWTGEVGDAGGVHLKFLDAAVLLFDAHIKLARDRIVKVLDTKRARRHLGVIEHPALLANHHPRVGAGHAADFRGIAPEVGGQHVVVAAQVDAGVAKAAEQVRVQVVFADDQVRAQRRHGAQRIKTAPGEIVL